FLVAHFASSLYTRHTFTGPLGRAVNEYTNHGQLLVGDRPSSNNTQGAPESFIELRLRLIQLDSQSDGATPGQPYRQSREANFREVTRRIALNEPMLGQLPEVSVVGDRPS